jgi:hypothetical protein
LTMSLMGKELVVKETWAVCIPTKEYPGSQTVEFLNLTKGLLPELFLEIE